MIPLRATPRELRLSPARPPDFLPDFTVGCVSAARKGESGFWKNKNEEKVSFPLRLSPRVSWRSGEQTARLNLVTQGLQAAFWVRPPMNSARLQLSVFVAQLPLAKGAEQPEKDWTTSVSQNPQSCPLPFLVPLSVELMPFAQSPIGLLT